MKDANEIRSKINNLRNRLRQIKNSIVSTSDDNLILASVAISQIMEMPKPDYDDDITVVCEYLDCIKHNLVNVVNCLNAIDDGHRSSCIRLVTQLVNNEIEFVRELLEELGETPSVKDILQGASDATMKFLADYIDTKRREAATYKTNDEDRSDNEPSKSSPEFDMLRNAYIHGYPIRLLRLFGVRDEDSDDEEEMDDETDSLHDDEECCAGYCRGNGDEVTAEVESTDEISDSTFVLREILANTELIRTMFANGVYGLSVSQENPHINIEIVFDEPDDGVVPNWFDDDEDEDDDDE